MFHQQFLDQLVSELLVEQDQMGAEVIALLDQIQVDVSKGETQYDSILSYTEQDRIDTNDPSLSLLNNCINMVEAVVAHELEVIEEVSASLSMVAGCLNARDRLLDDIVDHTLSEITRSRIQYEQSHSKHIEDNLAELLDGSLKDFQEDEVMAYTASIEVYDKLCAEVVNGSRLARDVALAYTEDTASNSTTIRSVKMEGTGIAKSMERSTTNNTSTKVKRHIEDDFLTDMFTSIDSLNDAIHTRKHKRAFNARALLKRKAEAWRMPEVLDDFLPGTSQDIQLSLSQNVKNELIETYEVAERCADSDQITSSLGSETVIQSTSSSPVPNDIKSSSLHRRKRSSNQETTLRRPFKRVMIKPIARPLTPPNHEKAVDIRNENEEQSMPLETPAMALLRKPFRKHVLKPQIKDIRTQSPVLLSPPIANQSETLDNVVTPANEHFSKPVAGSIRARAAFKPLCTTIRRSSSTQPSCETIELAPDSWQKATGQIIHLSRDAELAAEWSEPVDTNTARACIEPTTTPRRFLRKTLPVVATRSRANAIESCPEERLRICKNAQGIRDKNEIGRLQSLHLKWRNVAQQLCDILYARAAAQADVMGSSTVFGAQTGWSDYQTTTSTSMSVTNNGDRYFEDETENASGLTLQMFLQHIGIDEKLIGFDAEYGTWQ